MKMRRMLSVLCLLTLLMSCLAAGALASEAAETKMIAVEWRDDGNADGLRPGSIVAVLEGTSVTLSSENGWAGVAEGSEAAQWALPDVAGYTRSVATGEITLVTYTHTRQKTSYTAAVSWEDQENRKAVRPASVQLRLLADGKPYGASATLNASNGWTVTWANLPVTRAGETEAIVYAAEAVKVPAYYSASATASGVTFALESGSLTLANSASGLPEDVDAGTISLTVTGPDPRMPLTLTLGQFTEGRYALEDLLPGAYLVLENNAVNLAEGYVLDAEESRIGDAVMVRNGESAKAELRNVYVPLEEVQGLENENPTGNYGALSFEIIGPDSRMPLTVSYSEFTNGRYELDNLSPGVYAVIERNAGTLVTGYMLQSDSVTGVSLNVTAEGTATASLYNHYAPYPVPTQEEEFVNIPVTKLWSDNGNVDGNRPANVTVHLYANGAEAESVQLSEATGWTYVFENLPRYDAAGEEIRYTVNEDPVTWYATAVNGFTITNTYTPEVTSVSVRKIWDDNGNALGRRPLSIAMTLSNGMTVILNEANGWSATINNLPTRVNGEPVTYSWKEQSVLGYTLTDVTQEGSTMVFTNSLWQRPELENGEEPPKVPGNVLYVFEEYETPLGVEVMINHVGDCFD